MGGTFNPQILVDKLARLNNSQASIESILFEIHTKLLWLIFFIILFFWALILLFYWKNSVLSSLRYFSPIVSLAVFHELA